MLLDSKDSAEQQSWLDKIFGQPNNFSTFLDDQMMAIKTIISNENDSEGDSGPQVQYDSAAYKSQISWEDKSFETIVEEAESNEGSVLDKSIHNQCYTVSTNKYKRCQSSGKKNEKPVTTSSVSPFSSQSTSKICKSGVEFKNLKFPNCVFKPKNYYKNSKYWEWLNYDISQKEFVSNKCFQTGNKVKRRRKDSEFASRQFSKYNGLSSLSLSKSFNYDTTNKNEPVDNCQFAFSNIFQSEGVTNQKAVNELDFDDDYGDVSIPFEWSIPNKDLEAFLKDTYNKDTVFSGTGNEDLHLYDTFSPNAKEIRRPGTSQKDINTGFLNQPPTCVNKDSQDNCKSGILSNLTASRKSNRYPTVASKAREGHENIVLLTSEDSECNLKNTQTLVEVINKPVDHRVVSPREKWSAREIELKNELEYYQNLVEEKDKEIKRLKAQYVQELYSVWL